MPAKETLLDHSGLGSRPRVIGEVRKRPLIARVIGLLGLVWRRPACDFLRTVGQGSAASRLIPSRGSLWAGLFSRPDCRYS